MGDDSEHSPPVIKIGNYVLGKTLGQGAMGKVKLAEHCETGHKVAVKIMNREKMRNMAVVDKIRMEITNQQRFRHPHIIRLFQAFSTPSDFFLIMEYAPGGELFSQIVAKGRLKEQNARLYFQQLVSAIDYCHRHRVVHRDIKPENILLDSYNNVKIADFGLSAVLMDGEFLDTSCGSPNYASPEILSGKCYAGPEVDIWSCGVILYAMCAGHLPFESASVKDLFAIIKSGEYETPLYFSHSLRTLIAKLLHPDAKERATVKDLLADEWFRVKLPAYLFLKDVADVSKVDLDSVKEIASNTDLTMTEVKEAVANGNPVDPIVVAYYLLADNFGALGVSATTGGPEKTDASRLRSHNIIAGLIGGEMQGEARGKQAEDKTKDKQTAHVCTSAHPQRWCRDNCELCPRWAGVTACVFGPFLPSLQRCEACDQLNKPGCAFNTHVEPPSIEDLGGIVSRLARSGDSSDDDADAGSESTGSGSAAVEKELGVATTAVRVVQKRFQKRRWHLGIRSQSPPQDIMIEMYRVMLSVGLEWQVESPFVCFVRPKAPPGSDTHSQEATARVSLYQLDSRSKGGYLVDFRLLTVPTSGDSFADRSEMWPGGNSSQPEIELSLDMSIAPAIPVLENKSEILMFFEMASKVILTLSKPKN